MDRLFRESDLMREKWDEVHYANGQTYGEVTIERALEVTDGRYDPSTGGGSQDETDGSEMSTSVTIAASVGSSGDATLEGERGRSRAHLLKRNRLLRQRVEEQAARIGILEAALERQSPDQSSASSSTTDDREGSTGLRRRVQDWLTRGG